MWYVVFGILIFLVAIMTYYYIVIYNYYAKPAQPFTAINTLLQERCNLMNKLVKLLKEYASSETNVLNKIEKLTDIKVDALNRQGKMELHNVMVESLSHIKNLANKYPDVLDNSKYNESVLTLEKLNDDFSILRKDYNDKALAYNNFIDRRMVSFFARILNYKKRDLFGISDGERNSIRVDI